MYKGGKATRGLLTQDEHQTLDREANMEVEEVIDGMADEVRKERMAAVSKQRKQTKSHERKIAELRASAADLVKGLQALKDRKGSKFDFEVEVEPGNTLKITTNLIEKGWGWNGGFPVCAYVLVTESGMYDEYLGTRYPRSQWIEGAGHKPERDVKPILRKVIRAARQQKIIR
jgi:hypothetical protein